MKKLTSILLIAVMLISLFSFSSCGEDEPQVTEPDYEVVNLTKYNYSDYLVFNYYSSDQDSDYIDGKYNLSGTVHAECSSANESYRFEKVTIELTTVVMASPNLASLRIKLNLNSYGEAHGSDSYFIADSNNKQPSNNGNWNFKIKSISGTVKVPAE